MILPRRRVASLLLSLLLIGGPVAAAAHRPQEWQPRFSVTGLLSEAWALVCRIWEKAGGSSDPFGKEGGSNDTFGKAGGGIDPFGNPTSNTTQPPSDSTSAASQPSGS